MLRATHGQNLGHNAEASLRAIQASRRQRLRVHHERVEQLRHCLDAVEFLQEHHVSVPERVRIADLTLGTLRVVLTSNYKPWSIGPIHATTVKQWK